MGLDQVYLIIYYIQKREKILREQKLSGKMHMIGG